MRERERERERDLVDEGEIKLTLSFFRGAVCVLLYQCPLSYNIGTISKRLFGSSISITHNSKIVGPIVKSPFGSTITLFPVFFLLLSLGSGFWVSFFLFFFIGFGEFGYWEKKKLY